MKERVDEECRIARLRRDAGHSTDGCVRTACAVQELQIREYRLARSGQPNWDSPLHLIEVQRTAEGFTADDCQGVTWCRRDKDLGVDARHLHVRCVRHFRRQRAGCDTEGVGVELVALESLSDNVNDSV